MPAGICILDGCRGRPTAPEGILERLADRFAVPVRRLELKLELERARDPGRGQYHATRLIEQIVALAEPPLEPGERRIALVDVDLFIPVLTFVFGQAQLGGAAAVVSVHRLANEFYGLREDRLLFDARVEKELVHELGHQFGLLHCRQFECVMRSSTYVEEIDLKRAEFCRDCAAKLRDLAGREREPQPGAG